MAKWNYKLVGIPRNSQAMKGELRKRGDDGWELCALWEQKTKGNPFTAIFKKKED